jgi:hypothetical protein
MEDDEKCPKTVWVFAGSGWMNRIDDLLFLVGVANGFNGDGGQS